jgi:hypothetical protein
MPQLAKTPVLIKKRDGSRRVAAIAAAARGNHTSCHPASDIEARGHVPQDTTAKPVPRNAA